MSKHLRLLQIVPYIRLLNSYYFPSFEFERLLRINRVKITQFFSEYLHTIYGVRKPDYKLRPQIEDIMGCNVFEDKNSYIIGKEEIFNDFLERMYKVV